MTSTTIEPDLHLRGTRSAGKNDPERRAMSLRALSALKARQQSEAHALGVRWADDRLIAVSDEAHRCGPVGTPINFSSSVRGPDDAASGYTGCAILQSA